MLFQVCSESYCGLKVGWFMSTCYSALRRSILNYAKNKSKSYCENIKRYYEDLLRLSLKLGESPIQTEGADKYNVSKSTVMDKITVYPTTRFLPKIAWLFCGSRKKQWFWFPSKTACMVWREPRWFWRNPVFWMNTAHFFLSFSLRCFRFLYT